MALRTATPRSKRFRPALVAQLREAVRRRLYRIDVAAIADRLAERAKGAVAMKSDEVGPPAEPLPGLRRNTDA